MQTAFKEWAAICRALAQGRQDVILRKGGIIEPGGAFRLDHREFLLLPTFLHQAPESLIPEARDLLIERLAGVLARRSPAGPVPVVLFIDLDRFKNINDTLGHDAGDLLLCEMAQRLRRCLRKLASRRASSTW